MPTRLSTTIRRFDDFSLQSRLCGNFQTSRKQQRLNKYMHMLLKIAQTNGRFAILVTNQMQSAPDQVFGSNPIPIGGYIMSYASTYRIPLRRVYPEKFCAKLGISPGHPELDTDFAIDKRGVVDYIDNQKGYLSV